MKFNKLQRYRKSQRRKYGVGDEMVWESNKDFTNRKVQCLINELQQMVDILKENDNEIAKELVNPKFDSEGFSTILDLERHEHCQLVRKIKSIYNTLTK